MSCAAKEAEFNRQLTVNLASHLVRWHNQFVTERFSVEACKSSPVAFIFRRFKFEINPEEFRKQRQAYQCADDGKAVDA